MAVSASINPDRWSAEASEFRDLVGGRVTLVSFVTVTELRYGALKAGWGELRRRGLERDLDRFTVVQPDDEMMKLCAALRVRCERDGHGLGQKIHEADHPQVLMPNMTQDTIFPPDGTLAFFAAIPGHKKRLMFWEGGHVGLPAESIRQSIEFLKRYTA